MISFMILSSVVFKDASISRNICGPNSSSKAALIGLTKSLAKEVGPSGVRVNGIAPGWIETGMNAHLSEDEKKAFCMETALNGTGSAEDVANAALFLASENASYVTGQVLAVDGGYLI